MSRPERIGPKETYQEMKAGAALLICAYDSDEKFRIVRLEGAISFNEFKSRLSSLPKDQGVVFLLLLTG